MATPKVYEDLKGWVLYPVSIDGRLADIHVDAGVAFYKDTPRPEQLLTISLPSSEFPSELREEATIALLDSINKGCKELASVVFVGRTSLEDEEQFHLYCPAAIDEIAELLVRDTPDDVPLSFCFQGDPGWRTYLESLYPNEMGYQFILLRKTISSSPLPRAGKLQVRHFVHFQSPEGARSFRKVLSKGNPGVTFEVLENLTCNTRIRMEIREDVPSDLMDVYSSIEQVMFPLSDYDGRYGHFEWDEAKTLHASPEELLAISAEVTGGIRSIEDLSRFGIKLGPWRVADPTELTDE